MRVVRTFDTELIYAIATSPELWAVIAEDGQDPLSYVPDVVNSCCLVVYDGSILIGAYIIRRINRVTAEIHAMVLPKRRKEYSITSTKSVLQWVWDNVDWCSKIIAWVPVLYPNVRKHAEAVGFEHEGMNMQSYLKNGEIVDQWLLGLVRSQ